MKNNNLIVQYTTSNWAIGLVSFIKSFNPNFLFLINFILFSSIVLGQTQKTYQSNTLNEFINKPILNGYSIISQQEITESVINYRLNPIGFVIIDHSKEEIIAFSLENNFHQPYSLDYQIVNDLLMDISNSVNHFEAEKDTKDTIWGPFIQNLWGQVNCTDNSGNIINVTNIYTPNNYAAGCVAISQVSILKHYQWPKHGSGSFTYSDNYGSSKGEYSVNFEESNYNWNLALNRYRGKSSTSTEREIAGITAYHSAVSLSMDFEYNGSTSNVNRIPDALNRNFRFSALHKANNSDAFWTVVDSNMVWGRPAILAISSSNGYGHSIICDGLRIIGDEYFYHLNMGWWGTSNGWYKIRNTFNAGGYNTIDGGVFNILPKPELELPIIINESESDTVKWIYPEQGNADAFELQWKINEDNWETLITETSDTFFIIEPEVENNYKFRVRAKTNGRWYPSWSEELNLVWSYSGIQKANSISITSQPNPFTNNLFIQSDKMDKFEVKIINSLGQLIHSEFHNRNTLNIETSDWPSGVYFIHIQSKTAQKTIKCIKE